MTGVVPMVESLQAYGSRFPYDLYSTDHHDKYSHKLLDSKMKIVNEMTIS
ncbi:unnamed protein product [Camellia sinensis]